MEPASAGAAQQEDSSTINMRKTNECMTPDATTACLSKESSLEKNIYCEQKISPNQPQGNGADNERQSSQKNLQLVKQKSMSTNKKSGNNRGALNSTNLEQGGIVSKSSKKRSTKKSKTVNMCTGEFSSNTGLGRVLQQQATFEV